MKNTIQMKKLDFRFYKLFCQRSIINVLSFIINIKFNFLRFHRILGSKVVQERLDLGTVNYEKVSESTFSDTKYKER